MSVLSQSNFFFLPLQPFSTSYMYISHHGSYNTTVTNRSGVDHQD